MLRAAHQAGIHTVERERERDSTEHIKFHPKKKIEILRGI